MLRRWAPFLAAVLLLSPVQQCLSQVATTQPSGEELELRTLEGQLEDPARSPKTKAEAAGMLLMRSSPRAGEILLSLLASNDNPAAQTAIAQAIASSPGRRGEFVEPLYALLTATDSSVRAAAAEALASYSDDRVLARLLAVAGDGSLDAVIRTDTIAALAAAPDKQTVQTLVDLLDDPAPAVRRAAAGSLAALTNIRSFGTDAAQWDQWWQANKDKDRLTWLTDLAEGLARAKAALEADNARLRERLVRTLGELYDATPAPQREAMLIGFLKDPLPDVRLVGLRLVDRRIAGNEPLAAEIPVDVRNMLGDADSRVRQESAVIVASMADGRALEALLGRLQVEELPAVREALLKALGQLRLAEAAPAVLAEIGSKHENVSSAAAAALSRIAATAPLEGGQRAEAAKALIERYEETDPAAGNNVALREALLSAMGAVGDESFMPVLAEAVHDPAPKVRLAAVTSLAKVGKASATPALAGLTSDNDRGVRQAAVAALGTVGGTEQLPTILKLTDPSVEPEPAVRQQAWDVALAILSQASEQTLATVEGQLAGRPDAVPQRIEILKMLVDKLKTGGGKDLASAQRRLGEALMQASRPAEAAAPLAEAYASSAARGDGEAMVMWDAWVDALIAADDPACITAMASQSDDTALAGAFRRLLGRLSELGAKEKYLPVILLSAEASSRLAERMSEQRLKMLQDISREAKTKQAAIDQQKVASLVPLLGGQDEVARSAAADLQAMSSRAVLPLLAELRKAVASEAPDPMLEHDIVEVLRQVSPKLTGYDPSAPVATRLQTIDTWTRQQRQ